MNETKRPPEEQCWECGHLFGALTFSFILAGSVTYPRHVVDISREDRAAIILAHHIEMRGDPDIRRLKISTTKQPDDKHPEVRHFCQRCG